ncbi:MAG: NAD(P)H-quinone oxidoreductase [Pseudomonadota bacterium]
MTKIPQAMRAIVMREPGGPVVLELAEIETPTPRPKDVLVKVTAAGVNGPDLVQRRGHYPPPEGASPHLGLEVSGEVVATGADVRQWAVGDRIVALTNGGGYAEYVAVDAAHCLPAPAGVDEIEAAGLPETYFTVWSNVFHNQSLPKNGVFLVHGGAGGIGSTAIQLGRALGLKVLTTVGDDAAARFVTDLGAAQAINFKTEDFVALTREVGGADIILDIIGGDYIARNIKAASPDARIIQLAFNAGAKVEINLMPIMLKRLTYTGSTLRSRPDAFKAEVATALTAQVWPLFSEGALKPVTHATLPLGEAQQAHEMMESAAHLGKILLTP